MVAVFLSLTIILILVTFLTDHSSIFVHAILLLSPNPIPIVVLQLYPIYYRYHSTYY